MIRQTTILLFAAAALCAQDAKPAAADTKPTTRPADTRPTVVKDHQRMGLTVNADKLDRENVAKVDNVAPGSPAFTAGVRAGDEIVSVAGVAIVNDAVYRRTMAAQKAGTKVPVVVKRDGKEQTLEVELNGWAKPAPDQVTVQHVLISFATAKSPSNGAKRTQEEAKKLAEEIKQRAINGEDFGALAKENTDDVGSKNKTPAGQYVVSNSGRPTPAGGLNKDGSVPGFGYLCFALAVGEVQIVPYDPKLSPFGYHVIKRTN